MYNVTLAIYGFTLRAVEYPTPAVVAWQILHAYGSVLIVVYITLPASLHSVDMTLL